MQLIRAGGEAVDLEREVARLGRELPGGLAGRVVAIVERDAAALLAAVLAVLEAGAVAAPLDTRAPVDALLARARPALVVRDGRVEAAADPRLLPAGAALLLFTSGSTGEPKGVVLGRAGLEANIAAILGYLPVSRFPRTAIVLPLCYSYALVGQALVTWRAGGTLILADSPYPAVQLETLARHGAEGLSSVPTSLRLLARAGGARLGYVASAGGALDEAARATVRAAFPGARLFNQYGLTEASPRVTAIADDDPRFDRGSVGRPLPGTSVEVDAAGEVWVRGPSLMLGYLDEPPLAGPLRTGDRGRLEDGYLWIEGRGDGVVKIAGERVSVEEVAAALRAAPGVTDACVVAVPDALLGARLVAFIEGDAAAARRVAGERLPPAKRPARVVALERLPRLPGGKVALSELRARAQDA